MADEEACRTLLHNHKQHNRLRLSITEQLLIGTMLFTLAVAMIDAMDGNKIGNNNALELAKQQGQQELMAARLK